MSTNRTVKRELPVELSEEELRANGGFMADKLKEVERITEEAKRVAAEYKARKMKLNEEISRLAESRVKGFEVRPITCEERWHAGSIQVVRLDTGEVVDARPATLADAQENLPITGATDLRNLDDKPAKVIDLGVGKAVTSSVGDTVFVARDDEELPKYGRSYPGKGELASEDPDVAQLVRDVDAINETIDVEVEVDGLDADGNVVDDADGNPGVQTFSEALDELDQEELDAAHQHRKDAEAENKAAEEVVGKRSKGKGGKKKGR